MPERQTCSRWKNNSDRRNNHGRRMLDVGGELFRQTMFRPKETLKNHLKRPAVPCRSGLVDPSSEKTEHGSPPFSTPRSELIGSKPPPVCLKSGRRKLYVGTNNESSDQPVLLKNKQRILKNKQRILKDPGSSSLFLINRSKE